MFVQEYETAESGKKLPEDVSGTASDSLTRLGAVRHGAGP